MIKVFAGAPGRLFPHPRAPRCIAQAPHGFPHVPMQFNSSSLEEATHTSGYMSYLVQEQANTASFRVKAQQENVYDVVVPAFDVDRAAETGEGLGLECLKPILAF